MLQTADSLRNVLSSMFLALLNMRADAFSTRSLQALSQVKRFWPGNPERFDETGHVAG